LGSHNGNQRRGNDLLRHEPGQKGAKYTEPPMKIVTVALYIGMVAFAFAEWLFLVEHELIDRAVIASYDRAFQQGLENLIQRTRDPVLRSTFEQMRSCPIKTSSGSCVSFGNYLVGAIIRHNIHRHSDPEQALSYMIFRMLSPVGETGKRKGTLWDFDESRPYAPGENPLEARFKTFVMHDLRTICGDRIRRIRNIDRPQGTISITPGRSKDDPQGGIGAGEIPGRESSAEDELMADIMDLLKKRSSSELDLVSLFQSILRGDGTRHQRQFFGHNKADLGRKIIVATIRQYAEKTENHALLRLLHRIENPEPRQPPPPKAPPKPEMPRQEKLFRSIVELMEKHGRKVGSAILGKFRRRWVERKDPSGKYPNLLAAVLADMTAAGVIERQGLHFVPGPRYSEFLPQTVLQTQ
jgi:hypothetical protein